MSKTGVYEWVLVLISGYLVASMAVPTLTTVAGITYVLWKVFLLIMGWVFIGLGKLTMPAVSLFGIVAAFVGVIIQIRHKQTLIRNSISTFAFSLKQMLEVKKNIMEQDDELTSLNLWIHLKDIPAFDNSILDKETFYHLKENQLVHAYRLKIILSQLHADIEKYLIDLEQDWRHPFVNPIETRETRMPITEQSLVRRKEYMLLMITRSMQHAENLYDENPTFSQD